MLTPTPAGQLRNLDPLILDNVGGVKPSVVRVARI
jgi:hypothetical protein